MPTLYHAPNSRSSRIISQLMLMGKLDEVEVVIVDVPRADGTGGRDPKNPHPEGKVPFLVTDDGEHVRESAAIMMYLDELFGAPLSVRSGAVGRGAYLSWMSYYAGVLEPAMVAHFCKIDNPMFEKTFRSMTEVAAEIERGIEGKSFLAGDKLTLADIIVVSTFQFAPHLTPDTDEVRAWVERVVSAQDGEALMRFEAQEKSVLGIEE